MATRQELDDASQLRVSTLLDLVNSHEEISHQEFERRLLEYDEIASEHDKLRREDIRDE